MAGRVSPFVVRRRAPWVPRMTGGSDSRPSTRHNWAVRQDPLSEFVRREIEREDDRRRLAALGRMETFAERSRRLRGREQVLITAATMLALVAGLLGTALPAFLTAVQQQMGLLVALLGTSAAVALSIGSAGLSWSAFVQIRHRNERPTSAGAGRAAVLAAYKEAIATVLPQDVTEHVPDPPPL